MCSRIHLANISLHQTLQPSASDPRCWLPAPRVARPSWVSQLPANWNRRSRSLLLRPSGGAGGARSKRAALPAGRDSEGDAVGTEEDDSVDDGSMEDEEEAGEADGGSSSAGARNATVASGKDALLLPPPLLFVGLLKRTPMRMPPDDKATADRRDTLMEEAHTQGFPVRLRPRMRPGGGMWHLSAEAIHVTTTP